MCLYLSLSALHVSGSLVHHQERRFGAVYHNWYMPVYAGISWYHTSGWCVIITTQEPDVPAYTNCDIQLQNIASDDGLKSPKHVERLMINKDTL